jgi:CubicO group peptidase (beta-lactamase class C family)
MIAQLLLLTLVAAPLTTPPVESAPPAADVSPLPLREVAERVRLAHHVPALAIAVTTSTGPIESTVVGTLRFDGEELANPRHLFHVGSCTKAMTATMIATLIDEGTLSWQSTIAEVFPEIVAEIKPDFAAVTLHQLLTHTGGVPPATAGNSKEYLLLNAQKGSPQEQRRAMLVPLLSLDPVAVPGTKHVYSNAGYGVAAAMAEHITGRAWEDLMQQRLFTRLDMKSAVFGWPATAERLDQPLGHFPGAGDAPAVMEPDFDYRLAPAARPAGDVSCTIDDFARFAQLHLRGLRGEKTILRPDTMKQLHQPALSNYACGWVGREIGGKESQWHNGCAGPFFAWMTIWPEDDLAVVVLTNSGAGEPACAEITAAVLNRFSPTPPTQTE